MTLKQTNKELVNKIFIDQNSPEPKVKVFIPMYEPLETIKCKKCGKIIVEAKELIELEGQKSATYVKSVFWAFLAQNKRFSSLSHGVNFCVNDVKEKETKERQFCKDQLWANECTPRSTCRSLSRVQLEDFQEVETPL